MDSACRPNMRLLQIEGPDEEAPVWACSGDGDPNVWCQNLGPADKVAEVLSQWLGTIDYDEVERLRDEASWSFA